MRTWMKGKAIAGYHFYWTPTFTIEPSNCHFRHKNRTKCSCHAVCSLKIWRLLIKCLGRSLGHRVDCLMSYHCLVCLLDVHFQQECHQGFLTRLRQSRVV